MCVQTSLMFDISMDAECDGSIYYHSPIMPPQPIHGEGVELCILLLRCTSILWVFTKVGQESCQHFTHLALIHLYQGRGVDDLGTAKCTTIITRPQIMSIHDVWCSLPISLKKTKCISQFVMRFKSVVAHEMKGLYRKYFVYKFFLYHVQFIDIM